MLLETLSHGLRVELARYIWRDFLSKVHLFRGCTGQFLDAMCVMLVESHYGPEQIIGTAGEVSSELVILVYGGLEASPFDKPDKIRKQNRKGTTVGPLSFFFGVKQFMTTRASRSGAVCICIARGQMDEVLQIYPKDEERVKKNALAFYSKKTTEGSVAGFSTFSGASAQTERSDDSDDSDAKSRSSRHSANSASSKNTNKSKQSSASDGHRCAQTCRVLVPPTSRLG